MVAADLNGDGKVDLYVANDMNPNFLFLNRGDGTFEDATETSGAAFDEKGKAQSGMGVDAEDVDGDGLPELFVTNFANEYNTLYQNLGGGSFLRHRPPSSAWPRDSLPWVGWGTRPGRLRQRRLARLTSSPTATSTTTASLDSARPIDVRGAGAPHPERRRQAVPARRPATPAPTSTSAHVGRGAAFGDLDDDGDIDIVVNHKDGPAGRPPQRHAHETGMRGSGSKLVGTKSNRDADRHADQGRGGPPDDLPPAQGGMQHAVDQRRPRA